MKKGLYLIVVWLVSVGAFAQAQDTLQTFERFFIDGMKKIDGVFPVYVSGKKVYLEIPRQYMEREVEVNAGIDRGFDLISRPVKGLGVVRITSPDKRTICFQQPFYTERVLDEKSTYRQSFSLSNVQFPGVKYPILTYSPGGGTIMEITDFLLNGDSWFSYDYNFIRSLVPELSEIIKIHPFDEGVSFTIRRYHGSEAGQYVFSSSAVMLPEGSLPLEVTCVIRLLPLKKDSIRLADYRFPYQALRFKDYSQNPYDMVEDSLILRWDLSKPLVFYVDTLFPKEYFQAVRDGVMAWNDAFRKAGIRNALRVEYSDKNKVSAEQRAFIAYDLKLPGIKGTLTNHPRTGEILSCRLNVGHGFLQERMDDYLLSCGATDRRVLADRFSKVVEKELLQSEIIREVGFLLGLGENLSGSSAYPLDWLKDLHKVQQYGFTASVMDVLPYNYVYEGKGMPLKIGEDDYRAIYFGYAPVKGKNCYEQREYLRRWIEGLPDRIRLFRPSDKRISKKGDLSADPSGACAIGVEHLLEVLKQLDKVVYKNKERDRGSALAAIYRKAIRLYATYLKDIAGAVGSFRPAEVQHRAMTDLGKYLFHPSEEVECAYVKENLLETKSKILYPELSVLCKHLLSVETLLALRLQALQEKGYSDMDFFQDLYRELFNDFSPSVPVSYEQMDIQLLCLQTWLDNLKELRSLKENTIHDSSARVLEYELHRLCGKLEDLAKTHHQPDVRDIYDFFVRKIHGCF